jgi:hypothetical protein
MYNGVHEYKDHGGHYRSIMIPGKTKLGCGWGAQRHGAIFCQYHGGSWSEKLPNFDPSMYSKCGVTPAMLTSWKDGAKRLYEDGEANFKTDLSMTTSSPVMWAGAAVAFAAMLTLGAFFLRQQRRRAAVNVHGFVEIEAVLEEAPGLE